MVAFGALGGCETVVFDGVTGISVDARGAPVAVLAICEGEIDALTLYTDSADKSITVGEWDRGEPITGSATVPLAAPDNTWSVSKPMGVIRPGVAYALFGGTHDNRWATAHVAFSAERLAKLRPSQVLTQEYDEKADKDYDSVSDLATFSADEC